MTLAQQIFGNDANVEQSRATLYEVLKVLPKHPAAKVAAKLGKTVEEVEAGRAQAESALIEKMLQEQFGAAYTPPPEQ